MDFHKFSNDVMRFEGSEVSRHCGQGPAPLETFTRSQLAAISSIFIDFYDFHEFSYDFMDFEGRESRKPVAACAAEVLLLWKPVLDPSWLLFHRFS